MPMFGAKFGLPALQPLPDMLPPDPRYGGGPNADGSISLSSPPIAQTPQPGGFQPHALTLGDKIGLVGDIWSGNPVTQKRLDGDFEGDMAAYQLNAPKPQVVPGVGLVQRDPTTGQNKVLVPEPAKVPTIAENAAYLESQQPGLGKQYLSQYATNGGGQGPATLTVNGQQMIRMPGAATGPAIHPEAIARLQTHPEEAAMFDQQFGAGASAQYLKGGAAPATGPGGFPLYPSRH